MTDDDGSDSTSDVEAMRVRKARSNRVSYGEAEVVHESARLRVTVVPFFVDRTAGREVSFKVQTEERKKEATGAFAWLIADQKSITLTQDAATKLVEVIRRSTAVAREGMDGDFILIRVQQGVADVAALDPDTVSRAVASMLRKRDIVDHLANQELGPELVTALRGAIRLRELRNALAQLKHMLDGGVTSEADYQRWCEKHSWAFGSATLVPDSVRQIAIGDQVDFLVPSSLTGLRDLIELKRPDMQVLRYDSTHQDWYWSSQVSQAIGQCHRYLDALHEAARTGLRDHPEIVAYHPRATVVIGRSADWTREQLLSLHGLNARLNAIQVMTYDQLLAQGERLVESVAGPAGSAAATEDDDEMFDW